MIRSVTIRKVASGKYFASILVDSKETDFCVTSDDMFYGKPKHLRENEKKLVKAIS
ncbi:MAG: hypothetical protein IAC13_02310 [Firmicutes bacterium]|uniref:Transposase n=1 Tax=Candidatus Scybalomonas excrementavium TaxID=2840943 RepID=A0A9D9HZF3_9FIRM|nr:hypothetical protein [Candidatus Scybalomonas excrementavium]